MVHRRHNTAVWHMRYSLAFPTNPDTKHRVFTKGNASRALGSHLLFPDVLVSTTESQDLVYKEPESSLRQCTLEPQ